jgi:hypothetical protein
MFWEKLENGNLLISATTVDEQRLLDAAVTVIDAYMTTKAVHSSTDEDSESTLTPKLPGFPEAELPAHEYGSHHVGVPLSAFHETEDERKNRLSDQRIAEATARLLPNG